MSTSVTGQMDGHRHTGPTSFSVCIDLASPPIYPEIVLQQFLLLILMTTDDQTDYHDMGPTKK